MHAKTYTTVLTVVLIMSIPLALFIDRAFSQSTACTHYASPTGTGNGLSQSSPFLISNFWSVAKAGYVLCLLDGTYTGSSSMITPPENLKGTSGSPITVRALNDGKVLINGQGARRTVMLYVNDWFVIEGINACCSSESVVHVGGSNHNIVRRVVGWDAAEANVFIFGVHGGSHNLLEDVAGWGIARKIFDSSAGGNSTTIRRAWGRWEGSHFSGPKETYTLAYDNYGMICENCIGTWSGERIKQTYTLLCPQNPTYSKCGTTFTNYQVDQPQGIFTVDWLYGNKQADTKLLGSIAYVRSSDRFPTPYLILISEVDSFELRDVVAYIEPGMLNNAQPIVLSGLSDSSASNLLSSNLTSIGGSLSISSAWKTSNILNSTSTQNTFTGSQGATVCYQYQNGSVTTQPLWPWPMDQRIKDAMTISGHRSVTYGMASDNGLVTSAIEQMLGAIPTKCKTGGSAPSRPSPPQNLQVSR